MTDTAQNYQKLLTDVLQKQIIILGPQITLTKAHNVQGLKVADDGTVNEIAGDPKEIAIKVLEQFRELSPLLVKKTMKPLLSAIISSYPSSQPQPAAPEIQKPLEQVPVETAKPGEPEHHEGENSATGETTQEAGSMNSASGEIKTEEHHEASPAPAG